jgi:hypoxanthine phosphoribosyltransferase
MAFPPPGALRTLYDPAQIRTRVEELGRQITADYQGRSLVLVCVLKGSFMFTADLARAIALPLRIEFLGVQSYGNGTESTGVVQITQDLTRPLEGEDVLVVEDIVDSGLTLTYIAELLRQRRARSVKLCAMLEKPSRLKSPVAVDYIGFTIDDVFVVGYGLDHAQQYRNLPQIAELLTP